MNEPVVIIGMGEMASTKNLHHEDMKKIILKIKNIHHQGTKTLIKNLNINLNHS